MPGMQSQGLAVVGERLCQAVRDLKIEHGAPLAGPYVTLSVGGAVTVPAEEDKLADLVGIADRNMYEAKAKGRNQFVFHE
jgi:PleD family two-component response regulator